MTTEIIHELGQIVESDTPQISFTIQEGGSGLVPDELRLNIYNEETGAVVNSRSDVSLTPVSTYVNPSGVLTFNLLIADTALLNTKTKPLAEVRRVDFYWIWNSSTRRDAWLGRFTIHPREKQLDDA